MRFKCPDSLSYALLAEGKVDIVIQCANKIWDIHPIIPMLDMVISKVDPEISKVYENKLADKELKIVDKIVFSVSVINIYYLVNVKNFFDIICLVDKIFLYKYFVPTRAITSWLSGIKKSYI